MNEIKKLPLTSELEAKEIRCKIKNVDKDGKDSPITVYNIRGEKRDEVIKDLQNIANDTSDNQEAFNMFYLTLIVEFTDMLIDTKDVKFLLDSGKMAGQLLMQEFNDMIYELQYQMAMEQIANARNLALNRMAQYAIDILNDSERKTKIDKEQPKKKEMKNKRKFIK